MRWLPPTRHAPLAAAAPSRLWRARNDRFRSGWWVSIGLALGLLYPFAAQAAQVCKPAIPASTPTSRFTDHGDGTLTDNRTGLMWKQCLEGLSGPGCASGSVAYLTWQDALARPAAVNGAGGYAGHADWRLPNVKELRSIVEKQCYAPAINQTLFPNDPGSYVWSSSPGADLSYNAWLVAFTFGYAGNGGRDGYYAVRLVRGGE